MFLSPEWMDQGRTRYGDVPASGVDGSRKDEVRSCSCLRSGLIKEGRGTVMFLPPEWMDQGRTRYGDVPASGVD